MIEKSIETPYVKLRLIDGIIYCQFTEGLRMDKEIARLCVEARLKLSEGKEYPMVINIRGVHHLTMEAREYLAKEGTQLVTAGALLIKSPLAKALGNLFLTLNKPKAPTRLFTDEQEAIEWLSTFKKQSVNV